MKNIPVIKNIMTAAPVTVDASQTVAEAQQVMGDYDFRHLPVMEGDSLVGVLSDRDIHLALSLNPKSKPQDVLVSSVHVSQPFTVDVEDRLDSVLRDMVRLHINYALVTEDGKLAGIFTSVDACELFSEFLSANLPE